jgi:hypothetical protein
MIDFKFFTGLLLGNLVLEPIVQVFLEIGPGSKVIGGKRTIGKSLAPIESSTLGHIRECRDNPLFILDDLKTTVKEFNFLYPRTIFGSASIEIGRFVDFKFRIRGS